MDVEQLQKLADATYMLHYYTQSLSNTFQPGYSIPADYDNMNAYRLHLGNMCGHYRMEVGRLYNAIETWQNI